MKLYIIIPAHNEETRIYNTLQHYISFYSNINQLSSLQAEFIVVLNGCIDNTVSVVKKIIDTYPPTKIHIIETTKVGKGRAIRDGFEYALSQPQSDVIGFVDADMATSPSVFHQLIEKLLNANVDGVIGSRYMPGAYITPARPKIKRYGSKVFYEPLIWLLFGMNYYDYQCGAKVFKRKVIEQILPYLTIEQWACDVELLYLCKKYRYKIVEMPTIWHDQKNSKLKIMRNGFSMIGSLFVTRIKHLFK